jgi:hypothetical protein
VLVGSRKLLERDAGGTSGRISGTKPATALFSPENACPGKAWP